MSSGSTIAAFNGPGKVGISITSRQVKLHVAGDIRIGTESTGCVNDADTPT